MKARFILACAVLLLVGGIASTSYADWGEYRVFAEGHVYHASFGMNDAGPLHDYDVTVVFGKNVGIHGNYIILKTSFDSTDDDGSYSVCAFTDEIPDWAALIKNGNIGPQSTYHNLINVTDIFYSIPTFVIGGHRADFHEEEEAGPGGRDSVNNTETSWGGIKLLFN
jgi:hypothetical protein